jgi:ACS family hexuronate transporter-like MFS transporter
VNEPGRAGASSGLSGRFDAPARKAAFKIPNLRWWIAGLLLTSSMINYIDRQTLSVLAPFLKVQYRWNNSDLAWIFIVFRATYGIGQFPSGWFLDKAGTRSGLTLTVIWYSAVASLTSFAVGFRSLLCFRGLLGVGESANWPGAVKAVAEWFPKRERAVAVAVFDSGSSIGAALAPWLVFMVYRHFGNWRPVFLFTGLSGFLWVIAWRILYYSPQVHPNITDGERNLILGDRQQGQSESGRQSWKSLLGHQQAWGVILGRSIMDPVWFFVMEWLLVVLVSKGLPIANNLFAFWIPFVTADLGSLCGGAVSGWLIKRGWPIHSARKLPLVVFAVGLLSLGPVAYLNKALPITICVGTATFCYAAWTTIILVMPADLFQVDSVATVSGLSGTGGGLMTVLSTYLIGYISDRVSFGPVLIAAAVMPLVATSVVFMLVRKSAFEVMP